jgi:hypothetical protein
MYLMILSFLFVSATYAQVPSDSDVVRGNFFNYRGTERQAAKAFGPSNSVLTADRFGTLMEFDSAMAAFIANPNTFCPSFDGEEGMDNCLQNWESYFEPGVKDELTFVVNHLNSLKSFLNSDYHVELNKDALESPLALTNITWDLTEPGVSSGFSRTLNSSQNSVNSSLLSEIVNMQTMLNGSANGQMMVKSYISCVAQAMATGNPPLSFPEAQNRCQGGGSAPLSQFAFDDQAGGEFSLLSHLDHFNTSISDPEFAPLEPGDIRLTDMLFNNETDRVWRNSGLALDTGTGDNQDIIVAIRKSWLELFGDIRFASANTPDNYVSPDGSMQITQGANSGSRIIKSYKVPPYRLGNTNTARAPGGLQWYFSQLVQRNYETLTNFTYNMCVFFNDSVEARLNPDPNGPRACTADLNSFWMLDGYVYGTSRSCNIGGTPGNNEISLGGINVPDPLMNYPGGTNELRPTSLQSISFNGFTFNRGAASKLFDLFLREEYELFQNDTNSNELACIRLDTDTSACNNDDGQRSGKMSTLFAPATGGGGCFGENEYPHAFRLISDRVRVYGIVATRVAYGQLLEMIQEARRTITTLSSTTVDQNIKNQALGLIDSAVQGINVEQAQFENTAKLTAILDAIAVQQGLAGELYGGALRRRANAGDSV